MRRRLLSVAFACAGAAALFGTTAGRSDSGLLTVGADGRNRHTVARVRAGTGDASRGPVWSPDGRRLAFCLQGPETSEQGGVRASGELNLAVTNADGSGRRTITAAPGSEYGPACAPDGKSILLAWSPDGKTIAFDARKTPPES